VRNLNFLLQKFEKSKDQNLEKSCYQGAELEQVENLDLGEELLLLPPRR
jgi:hypothetical protein